MKFEYAVFTVRVPLGDLMGSTWPDEVAQTALLVRMNELGADGWEIFERSNPGIGFVLANKLVLFPYSLWARRRKP